MKNRLTQALERFSKAMLAPLSYLSAAGLLLAGEIIRRLLRTGVTRFRALFQGNRSRSEVVATFLAVLELCKARVLHLAGSETDCIVRQERDDVPENLTF